MNRKKIISNYVTACWLILMSQIAEPGFSGNAEIDAALVSYPVKAGGSHPGVERGFQVVECGTAFAHPFESNCPNDATYTPAQSTGGYQAWGVGVKTIVELDFEIVCGLEPVFTYVDGTIIVELELECEIEPVLVANGTLGTAMARLRWGNDIVTTGQISTYPTSVMAFHPNTMDECNPTLNLTSQQAPCDDTTDSSFVENNGYEDEITIADPTCQASERSGTVADRNLGCFTYDTALRASDLPSNYKDTTFKDPGSILNIGFGSADGSAITPGYTYTVWQIFSSNVGQNMVGTTAIHSGSITTELTSHPVCFGALFQPQWCFFAVDFASVGGPLGDTFDLIVPPI